MKPIPIPDAEVALSGGEPANMGAGQSHVNTLPAVLLGRSVDDRRVWSRWELSEDEKRRVVEGGVIDLQCWTFGRPVQPVLLTVPDPRCRNSLDGGAHHRCLIFAGHEPDDHRDSDGNTWDTGGQDVPDA